MAENDSSQSLTALDPLHLNPEIKSPTRLLVNVFFSNAIFQNNKNIHRRILRHNANKINHIANHASKLL